MRSTENLTGYPAFVLRSVRGKLLFSKLRIKFKNLVQLTFRTVVNLQVLVTLIHALLLASEKTGKDNTCKTCNILITSPEYTNKLTGKIDYTKSFDLLDCCTENVIYGIDCSLCGHFYAGETRQTLRSRMNKHRYDANNPQYRILHNHFNQPGHDRCLTMIVRIIEKIYHHASSP